MQCDDQHDTCKEEIIYLRRSLIALISYLRFEIPGEEETKWQAVHDIEQYLAEANSPRRDYIKRIGMLKTTALKNTTPKQVAEITKNLHEFRSKKMENVKIIDGVAYIPLREAAARELALSVVACCPKPGREINKMIRELFYEKAGIDFLPEDVED